MGLASLGRRGGDFGDTPAQPEPETHTCAENCKVCRHAANVKKVDALVTMAIFEVLFDDLKRRGGL